MKLVAQIALKTTPEQTDALIRTMHITNAACDWLSNVAFDRRVFNKFGLQQATYQDCRAQFSMLSSQVVIRCVAKVAASYAVDRDEKHAFKPLGAIAYDARILSFKPDQSSISIWTVDGRQTIEFVCGERQRELLQGKRGESDLCQIDGRMYLFVTCEVKQPTPADVSDVIGVDLGITTIAADSDGERFSGDKINDLRRKYRHKRQRLQKKGTKNAKRKLRQIRRRESRFSKHTNHVISKQVVKKAHSTGRAIALEELTGIRNRVKAGRRQRTKLHSWAFADLKAKIVYKAALAGVPVIFVDPRYTSQTCPTCGCVDKRNRPSQAIFRCIQCGHADHADTNAARNIRVRAAVNRPMESQIVSRHDASGDFQSQVQSLRL